MSENRQFLRLAPSRSALHRYKLLAVPDAGNPHKRRLLDNRRAAMTPQEQELVNELLDRLAKLEGSPRDPDAERLVTDGLSKTRSH
jgi:Uncharacterized protein conserved in bacteria (DUF2076)